MFLTMFVCLVAWAAAAGLLFKFFVARWGTAARKPKQADYFDNFYRGGQ